MRADLIAVGVEASVGHMNHADTRIDLDQLGSDTEGFAELCVGVAVVDSIPIDLAK